MGGNVIGRGGVFKERKVKVLGQSWDPVWILPWILQVLVCCHDSVGKKEEWEGERRRGVERRMRGGRKYSTLIKEWRWKVMS